IRPAAVEHAQLAAQLAHAMTQLDRLLEAIGFVLDHPLAVLRDGRAQRWAGLRRRRRIALPVVARPGLVEGAAVLLDGDGAPILVLDPVVQIAAPAPGEPDEVFVLDGNAPQGARLVAWPAGYERHDPALWQWVAALLDVSGETAGEARNESAPYLGLSAFGVGDVALYHGREREVEAFANRLRADTLLAVVGPSGAGKSSFIHAGVLGSLP